MIRHVDFSNLTYLQRKEIQVEAVKQKYNALYYIDTPVLEAQIEAVQKCGQAIKYIKYPSADVQMEAVKQNIDAIRFIDYPHINTQKYVVKNIDKNKKLLKFIDINLLCESDI